MIAVIQEEMIESLRDKLLQERCSGIFVMLDTTVNVALPNADYSRTGLYLKQTGYAALMQQEPERRECL